MAQQLVYQDYVSLSRFDPETKKLDLSDRRLVTDPESVSRLQKAGLVESNGALTKEGLEKALKLDEGVKQLRKGVPVERRKRSLEKLAWESARKWLTGTFKKQLFVTNGELVYVGKPVPRMGAVKMPGDVSKRSPKVIESCLKGKFVAVKPHTYQMHELGGMEIIWLADEKEEVMISVQAKYFDFVRVRFPKAAFFARKAGDVLQARVTNRGWKDNVVAVIMWVDTEGSLPRPEYRWR